jgi:MoaA/NifB/PqqE/SkfB family radical SAM enzyme
LPQELFGRIEREMFPYARRLVIGVGGEPMISPHFFDYVRRAHAAGLAVHVMTNGSRINTDEAAGTLASCLSSMEISVDGATKETYERIRIGAKWENLVRNLERLDRHRKARPVGQRPHLTLCYVLMKSNVHEFPAFVEFAQRIGADRASGWHVIPVTEEGRRESLQDERARSNEILAQAVARGRELGIEVDVPAPFPLEGEIGEAPEATAPESVVVALGGVPAEPTGSGGLLADHPSDPEALFEVVDHAPPSAHLRAVESAPAGTPAVASAPAATPAVASAPAATPALASAPAAAPAASAPQPAQPATAAGGAQPDAVSPLPPAIPPAAPAVAQSANAASALHVQGGGIARERMRHAALVGRVHCSSPTTSVFVFFDGRVLPCCHPHAHSSLPMGNLWDQSFSEIWDGPLYRNLRKGLFTGDAPPLCQSCSIVHSPPPKIEKREELLAPGNDLRSWYAGRDLTAEEGLQPAWAQPALLEHVTHVVDELDQTQRHAQTVERERDALRAHTGNLEYMLRRVRGRKLYDALIRVERWLGRHKG